MKYQYINKLTLVILALSLGLLACEKKKEILATWDTAGTDGTLAHLRIIHASPNFRAIMGQADSLHIFANGGKVNGVRMSLGSVFPAQSPNAYVGLPPGNVELKLSVGGMISPDSIPLYSFKVKMEQGKYYSFLITDSLTNASKDSSRIFVRDSFPNLFNGRTGIRFINALRDTAGRTVDVWSTRRNNNLYSNVPSGLISSFSNQPFLNIPDTLIVRRAGTTNELARLNTITFANQRIYTILLRGDVTVTSGTRARTLTWVTNR